MTYFEIALIICGIILFAAFIFGGKLKDYIKSMALGTVSLLLITSLSGFLNIAIELSVASVASSVFFGIPGVIFSIMLSVIK